MTAVRQPVDGLSAVEELAASGRRIPARESSGIQAVSAGDGEAFQVMDPPPWMCDGAGTLLPGALGILADSVLGTAIMSTVGAGLSMVTSHLHLELFSAVPAGTTAVSGTGRQRSLIDRFGLGEGEIRVAGGPAVARATIGSVLITRRPAPVVAVQPVAAVEAVGGMEPARAGYAAPRSARRAHRLLAGSRLHQHLGTRVVRAGATGVTLAIPAHPSLANSNGGLHGGIGVMLGERTLDLALQVATEATGAAMRLVELRAAFLRVVPADGSPTRFRASVVHLGRRLAATRGEILTADGRVAVLLDANYVAAGPTGAQG